MGLVQDWSTRHVIYTKAASLRLFLAAQRDPRAFYSWKAAARAAANRSLDIPSPGGINRPMTKQSTLHTDWSVSLAGGTMGANMYPAKFTFDEENRRGQAIDSTVSGGCILSGGVVRNSVLSRGVKVHAGALVEDSIILDNCDIGRRAKVKRAILDKNVRIPEDAKIGYDLEQDRKFHHVTESGIVVVEGNRSAIEVATLFV